MSELSKEGASCKISQPLDYASPRMSRPKQSRLKERLAIYSVLLLMGAGGVLVLLPALNRAGCACGRTQCGANLHQIVSAFYMYAQEHDGRFPDSWENIITASDSPMTPQTWAKVLICPDSKDAPASGTTAAEVVKDISSRARPEQYLNSKSPPSLHLSYIYAGKGITTMSEANTVVVYEPLDHHTVGNTPSLNVAYRDGSVRTYSGPAAVKLFAELQAGHNPPRPEMLK